MVNLPIIDIDNLESKIMASDNSILLACIPQGYEFKEQIEVVEEISKKYHPFLKVCLVAQDSIQVLGKKFRIRGTPFFLIFEEGKEKGRLLGSVNKKTLISFLLKTLPCFRKNNGNRA